MKKLKKNFIISLIGVDGAGKTTLAKKLHKTIKNSQYLHLKPYIIFKNYITVIKNPHREKKSSLIFSLIRLFSWLLSYKFFFFFNQKKKFYIFDRYAHDILIDPLRYKHNLSPKLTKLILNFFPKPDLWVFANPLLKTIKHRKLELPVIELKRQIKDYTCFFKNKKNVLMLDTSVKKEKLIKQIVKKINNQLK
jgi:thymidylate kinase